ncbi:MAG: ABC transporter ATP-binding protein [Deltaproteobacteria bacterium]|nr:ABC transporter ATP-binding protein [Deltaproteobacteria bacterium]
MSIELRGVAKRFGDVVALHRLDLTVAAGELLVLLGPSGCGKSTTLRIVAGLEDPTEGEVHIGGRRVDTVDPKDRDVAMVFQGYALYPHLSVRENLAFPLARRGVPRPERAVRVTETARFLGLEPLLDRRPGELSGGERQRVAMGRALVRRPKVFLFDEPLSNLDARLRVDLRAEIARLHRETGATSLYVTHDQTEAMALGDRIAVLNAGRLEQLATPREIYERPRNRFVARFVGTPACNLLAVERGEGVVRAGPLVWAGLDLPPGPLEAGIRPEDLSLGPGDPGNAEVERVELAGPEAHVHLRAGETTLVARVPAATAPRPGDRVHLQAPADRVHWFGDTHEPRRAGRQLP